MKTAGIICEYNPFHLGHAFHIESTRRMLGEDTAVVCVMSGNFVQRGDFALFNKHARAKIAVLCGADLVVELPSPYALSSAERFASAGVHLLDSLNICDFISFGSESGDVGALGEAAEAIVSKPVDAKTREWLDKGLSYAVARQKAADAVLGARSGLFLSPNNLLGIEYLKAIAKSHSKLIPVTVKRTGAAHDSDTGCSASAIRKMLLERDVAQGISSAWDHMPSAAAGIFSEEIDSGRGPVSMITCELAILSRLRAMSDYSYLPDASEGLDHRLARYAASEATVTEVLERVKTKRYAMSRIRRMLICACLGISAGDSCGPPPYIRVLAMNRIGMKLLKESQNRTQTPVIVKPASAKKLSGQAGDIFRKEAAATDFYSLAYPAQSKRTGGQEWRTGPVIIEHR